MHLKTLAQKDAIKNISKVLKSNSTVVLNLLEILNSGKIAQPSKAFRDGIAKLKSPDKHNFTYLDLGQKQYFIPGVKVPFGQIKSLSVGLNKNLSKAKNDTEKTALKQQIYFLERLSQLSLKGFASGVMFFSKNTRQQNGQTEYLMSVKNGVAVGGIIKKGNLAQAINDMPYKMVAKNGDVMAFETIKNYKKDPSNISSNASDISLETIAQETKLSFKKFKENILPALNSKTLSEEQQQELKEISQRFEAFNQAIQQASEVDKASHQKLIDAIHKAAALILQVGQKEKGSDIINDDDIFSEEEKAAIQNLVKAIQAGLPLVKEQVIPNLKIDQSTPQDKKILSDLIDNISRFNDNYKKAPNSVQKQLTKFRNTVEKQQKQLQSILQKLEKKTAEQLNKMISPEQRREIMDAAKTEVDQILKELNEMSLA